MEIPPGKKTSAWERARGFILNLEAGKPGFHAGLPASWLLNQFRFATQNAPPGEGRGFYTNALTDLP
jgi:hypothetical protein